MNIDRFKIDFELSTPFSPIEQLMAVLPSESATALPEPCRDLMLSPTSEIADFYPRDVPVDPNGKAMPWLWVLLLPFIDEERLVETVAPKLAELTPEESKRNTPSSSRLFVHASHPLAQKMKVRHFAFSAPNLVSCSARFSRVVASCCGRHPTRTPKSLWQLTSIRASVAL